MRRVGYRVTEPILTKFGVAQKKIKNAVIIINGLKSIMAVIGVHNPNKKRIKHKILLFFFFFKGFKKNPMTIGCLTYKPQNTYGSKKGILRPYDHCVP